MSLDWTLIQNRLQDASGFMRSTGKPGWAELAEDALIEIRGLEHRNAQLLEALWDVVQIAAYGGRTPGRTESLGALLNIGRHALAAIKAAEEKP